MEELTLSKYSEKSYVVRGNTKAHRETLKGFGGRYFNSLKDGMGCGWIISSNRFDDVMNYIRTLNESDSPERSNDVVPLPTVKRAPMKVTAVDDVNNAIPSRYTYRGRDYHFCCEAIDVPQIGDKMTSKSGNKYEVVDSSCLSTPGKIVLKCEDDLRYFAHYVFSLKIWIVDTNGVLESLVLTGDTW